MVVSKINNETAFIDLLCSDGSVPNLGRILLNTAEEMALDRGYKRVNLHALNDVLAYKVYIPAGYRKCDYYEGNCSDHCYDDIKGLGRYDKNDGWEGYALTKCLDSSSYLASSSSPISDKPWCRIM